MRIAITANGPGEVAGWLRPLLRCLYQRLPDLEVHVFLVPDDYATGFEAQMVRETFPQSHVYEPKTYLKFAFGRRIDGVPDRVDIVQYLGGDLLHAARVHARLRGKTSTYKFSRRAYRTMFDRAYAVDDRNVAQLEGWGTPAERIERVGNLAIDGALLEAQQPYEAGTPVDGILIMPGSRAYEVENLIPFYFTAASFILRERPDIPIAFGLSPFTSPQHVREAIEGGGHPRLFARSGEFVERDGRFYLVSHDGEITVPVLFNAIAAAARARLVLTIPGTKTIELSILGKPVITITPLNAPEMVTFNGPLTYLDRLPFVGIPLKRAFGVHVSRAHRYHTQPNMDAEAMLVHELHGTVTPGRVARVALDRYDDAAWIASHGSQLAELYRSHIGAAERMATSLLALAN